MSCVLSPFLPTQNCDDRERARRLHALVIGATRERHEHVLPLGERLAARQVRELHRRLRVEDRLVRLRVEDQVHVRVARGDLPVLDVELHLGVAGGRRREHLVLGRSEDLHGRRRCGGVGARLSLRELHRRGRRRRGSRGRARGGRGCRHRRRDGREPAAEAAAEGEGCRCPPPQATANASGSSAREPASGQREFFVGSLGARGSSHGGSSARP